MLTLTTLGLILLPLTVMVIVIYLILKHYSGQQKQQFEQLAAYQDLLKIKIDADRKEKHDKEMLRMQLQAYERMVMFLERIHLPNLITRIISPSQPAKKLQASLLHSIREEYEHNLSQQLYISNEVWELIKSAKEEVAQVVNVAGAQMTDEDEAAKLAQLILGGKMETKADPIEKALTALKAEVKTKL